MTLRPGDLVVVPGPAPEVDHPFHRIGDREEPSLPQKGDIVQAFEPRTMTWEDVQFDEVDPGTEFLHNEALFVQRADGQLNVVDVPTDEELALAEAPWDASEDHRVPQAWDLVYVLGEEGGHLRLRFVPSGERVAFQGRVFDTKLKRDGKHLVRLSGDVITVVTNTYKRPVSEVIDATIQYDDGSEDVLTGTANHPFWVDAVRDYVPLGELKLGTQLHVQGGGEAVLVSKTWRQGDFEVFDFEVEGLHNFYVSGPDGDAAGVLVHNSTGGNTVYRGLAKGENAASGLSARAPGAGNSPISHVAGKKESQWISTTKDKGTAIDKFGKNGVVEIDLNKVDSDIVDLSGGIPNGGRMSNWAKKDREVLIKDHIPAEAVTPVK